MIDIEAHTKTRTPASAAVHAGWGALAGVAGGVIFIAVWTLAAGAVGLTIMGLLTEIGQGTVHVARPLVGLIVHFAISAVIGAIYGAAVTRSLAARRYDAASLFGLLNGVVWWVIGGLILLPVGLGAGPQLGAAFTPTFLVDLVAHALYGIATALIWAGASA